MQDSAYPDSRKTTLKEAKDYFSTLTEAQIKRLHAAYRVDFELFGYEADDFLLLGAGGARHKAGMMDDADSNYSMKQFSVSILPTPATDILAF